MEALPMSSSIKLLSSSNQQAIVAAAAAAAVALLLVSIKNAHSQAIIFSLSSWFLGLVLLFGLARPHSKKGAPEKKTLLLLFIAFYPVIASFLEANCLLLFTPCISGLICTLITDSLAELTLTHLSHSFLSYAILFCSKTLNVTEETEAVYCIGWKIGFFTSLIWMFAYRSIAEKNKNLVSQNHSLLVTIDELKKKTAQLESSLLEKENFMLSFSHEFKNLLNVLLGNLMLATKTNYQPVTKLLRSASLSAEVMKLMVLNVLDAGKHQVLSTIDIKMQRTHVPTLLENIWSVCSDIISAKPKLSAKILLGGQVPHFLTLDPQRMLQIFLNLVTNAVKFTDRGSIVIKVSWEETQYVKTSKLSTASLQTADQLSISCDPSSFDDYMTREKLEDEKIQVYETRQYTQPDAGYYEVNLTKKEWNENFRYQPYRTGTRGHLKISVQDTGSGMSKTQCNKLFSRFSQVSDDQSKRRLGSGLGLWITKQIVEQHYGKIDVDSKEGFGTKFDVVLPTSVEDAVGSPSIEIPNESMTGAKLLNFTRATLTRESLSKPTLMKPNLTIPIIHTSSDRIDGSRASIHIPLQSPIWASTTSLDSPMHRRSMADIGVQNFSQAAYQSKVLLVDDDPFNLELLGKFVTELIGPNKIICARSGQEALELIEGLDLSDVSVAFIDKNLGDMSGLDVIRSLKEASNSGLKSDIRCFLVSGDSRKIIQQDLNDAEHVDGYLPKPVEFADLAKVISEYYLISQ